MRKDCRQCNEKKPEGVVRKSSSFKTSRVIFIRDYLEHHLRHTRQELSSIKKEKTQLMSRLIREKDQVEARNLQSEIRRLEGDQSDLSDQKTHYKTLRARF